MPLRRPCIVHRCREYAMDGESRCEPHQREWQRSRWDQGSTGHRGSRPGWRALRLRVWREQGRRCGNPSCRKAVKVFYLHHKDGNATNDPTNGGDRANVVALCKPCHDAADAALRKARR